MMRKLQPGPSLRSDPASAEPQSAGDGFRLEADSERSEESDAKVCEPGPSLRSGLASRRLRWLIEPTDEIASASSTLLNELVASPNARPSSNANVSPWRALKLGPMQYVYRLTQGDRQMFCKWFEPTSSWSRRRGWRPWPTAAAAHLRWKRLVESLDIRTAPVVAAGEVIAGPIAIRQPGSFVISSSPSHVSDLRSWASDDAIADETRVHLAQRLCRCATALHNAGVGRLDFRPVNLLVDPHAGDLILFDFDSFAPLPRLGRAKRIEADMKKVRRTERFLLTGDIATLT